eukprot:5310098-Prymnesium_polylepis.1
MRRRTTPTPTRTSTCQRCREPSSSRSRQTRPQPRHARRHARGRARHARSLKACRRGPASLVTRARSCGGGECGAAFFGASPSPVCDRTSSPHLIWQAGPRTFDPTQTPALSPPDFGQAGFRKFDLIQELGGKPIKTAADAQALAYPT